MQKIQASQALDEENLSEEDNLTIGEVSEVEECENVVLESASPESAAEEKDVELGKSANEYIEATDSAGKIATYEIPSDAVVVASGNCGAEGDNVKWTVVQWEEPGNYVPVKQLTISGSGQMENYQPYTDRPWQKYYLNRLLVEEGVTSIGDYAFNGSN